jgi:hypothetical protein
MISESCGVELRSLRASVVADRRAKPNLPLDKLADLALGRSEDDPRSNDPDSSADM